MIGIKNVLTPNLVLTKSLSSTEKHVALVFGSTSYYIDILGKKIDNTLYLKAVSAGYGYGFYYEVYGLE